MKAYSQDLRVRVRRSADQGMPHPEIVRVLGVSLATIGRYLKQRRETGQVSSKTITRRPSKKIEEAFSKFKAFFRRIGARTRQDLYEALCQALDAITPQDALGWFAHYGYFLAEQKVE